MADWPSTRLTDRLIISTLSPEGLGLECRAMAQTLGSTSWPTASMGIFVPMKILEPVTVVQLFIETGTSAAGNVDVGIYDKGGSQITNFGSTQVASATSFMLFNINDVTLNPGLYYFAMSMTDTNANTHVGFAPAAGLCRALGVVAQAAAVPLPSTATFAATSEARIPF